jgi:hypothetical protein
LNHSSSPRFNLATLEESQLPISEYHPKPPGEVYQRPQSPRTQSYAGEAPAFFRANNFSQLFEYMQDSMLQLRDELRIRLNDQLM